MTVAELIAQLQELPPELPVFGDDLNGMGPVDIKRVERQSVMLAVLSADHEYKGMQECDTVILVAV